MFRWFGVIPKGRCNIKAAGIRYQCYLPNAQTCAIYIGVATYRVQIDGFDRVKDFWPTSSK